MAHLQRSFCPNRLGHNSTYCENPKISDTRKICGSHPKIWTWWLERTAMWSKDAEGIANSVDPDQTAPLGAIWSGSILFAQTCQSKNLGALRYTSVFLEDSPMAYGINKFSHDVAQFFLADDIMSYLLQTPSHHPQNYTSSLTVRLTIGVMSKIKICC